jgi:hypothetical protein
MTNQSVTYGEYVLNSSTTSNTSNFKGNNAASTPPNNMMSIYDYLGKPGGIELGKRINNYAKLRKPYFKQRWVDTPKFKGVVFVYPKEFLDEFFQIQSIFI